MAHSGENGGKDLVPITRTLVNLVYILSSSSSFTFPSLSLSLPSFSNPSVVWILYYIYKYNGVSMWLLPLPSYYHCSLPATSPSITYFKFSINFTNTSPSILISVMHDKTQQALHPVVDLFTRRHDIMLIDLYHYKSVK